MSMIVTLNQEDYKLRCAQNTDHHAAKSRGRGIGQRGRCGARSRDRGRGRRDARERVPMTPG